MDVRKPIPTNGGDWITKFGETWKKQAAQVKEKFGQAIEEIRMPVEYPTDVPILYVSKSSIVDVLRFLKEESGFEYGFLADITATDEEAHPRFEVVYNLFSHTHHWRIRLKVRVGEDEEVPTCVSVWKGANWAEREVFDMYGVKFSGHPDLRRILMDERWVGHPLRKDYPLKGYQIFTDPQDVNPALLE
jgi:NADH/F420H2 dehydrogenase subunit C